MIQEDLAEKIWGMGVRIPNAQLKALISFIIEEREMEYCRGYNDCQDYEWGVNDCPLDSQ